MYITNCTLRILYIIQFRTNLDYKHIKKIRFILSNNHGIKAVYT